MPNNRNQKGNAKHNGLAGRKKNGGIFQLRFKKEEKMAPYYVIILIFKNPKVLVVEWKTLEGPSPFLSFFFFFFSFYGFPYITWQP
jgi:hypothetical protein